MSELIGAERGERRPEDRATHRNGYRPRRWDTRAGEIELQIPKIRQGSYFPSVPGAAPALGAGAAGGGPAGLCVRRLDAARRSAGREPRAADLASARSAAICAALDEHVEAFRTRPLEGRYPYLFLDAKVEKVRDGGRVVSKALVIAHGVHETGRREILAHRRRRGRDRGVLDRVPRGLVARGLVGVQLAISDAHAGLKAAIAKVLGCAWQRCTVHFLSDCLGHARKDQHGAAGRADPPDLQRRLARAGARSALRSGRAPRAAGCRKIAALLEDAEDDILAFYAFPADALAQAALAPTRSSASTARSAAAPTSSASSPTTAR